MQLEEPRTFYTLICRGSGRYTEGKPPQNKKKMHASRGWQSYSKDEVCTDCGDPAEIREGGTVVTVQIVGWTQQ